jgi:hypothetical protein
MTNQTKQLDEITKLPQSGESSPTKKALIYLIQDTPTSEEYLDVICNLLSCHHSGLGWKCQMGKFIIIIPKQTKLPLSFHRYLLRYIYL